MSVSLTQTDSDIHTLIQLTKHFIPLSLARPSPSYVAYPESELFDPFHNAVFFNDLRRPEFHICLLPLPELVVLVLGQSVLLGPFNLSAPCSSKAFSCSKIYFPNASRLVGNSDVKNSFPLPKTATRVLEQLYLVFDLDPLEARFRSTAPACSPRRLLNLTAGAPQPTKLRSKYATVSTVLKYGKLRLRLQF